MDSKIPELNPTFFPGYTELVTNSADPFLKSPEILEVKEEEELRDCLTGKCLLERRS